MKLLVHAMTWAEIEPLLQQLTDMQADNMYTYHYPNKTTDKAYVRGKLMELERHLSAGNTLFAAGGEQGMVQGYIWCYTGTFIDQKRMYLNTLYVLPQQRGGGLAQALMAYAERWAQLQGCTELATHYAAFNHRAGAFYKAAGFEPNRVELVKKL